MYVDTVHNVATLVAGAPAALTGAELPLADIWGGEAVRFEERLRTATSWDDRFRIATDALGRRLDSHHAVDEESPAPGGSPPVPAVWRAWTVSRTRSAGAANGSGPASLPARAHPKEATQLVRFDHAAHLLAARHHPAAVAAESGYADQSHLHRDVKAITGATPTAVARAPWLAIDDVAWPSLTLDAGA